MNKIEAKLKELEQSVVKAKAFERNRQRAVAHGMKPDIPITLKIETAERLITALKEAVASLGGYATLPKGAYAGPDDLYHDLGDSASVTLTSIEKILGDQK